MSDSECGSEDSGKNQERDTQLAIPLCSDGGSDLDRFFEALADDHRRRIFICLQQNETVSLQDLAEFLADQEGIDPQSKDFQRLQADLMHLHLPKLADYGLLSFDERTNMVRREPLPTAVKKILDLVAELEGTDNSECFNE